MSTTPSGSCNRRRRQHSSAPAAIRCPARFIPTNLIERAIRDELRRIAPGPGITTEYRQQLRVREAVGPGPRKVTETAVRRLEEQLGRIARLYEFGEYEWEAVVVKRAEIREEQARLREAAARVSEPTLSGARFSS